MGDWVFTDHLDEFLTDNAQDAYYDAEDFDKKDLGVMLYDLGKRGFLIEGFSS